MRIISGTLRGRRIRAPQGDETRPMLDRVRESLFATLRDWIEDAYVLDLFAGSGSLGLEAISRGARAARMIERGKPAFETLRANVEELELGDRIELARADALDPTSWRAGDGLGRRTSWDLVFLDPPYSMMEEMQPRKQVLNALATLAREHLEPAGRVVLHTPRRALADREFPDDLAATLRQWGTNDVWLVGKRVQGART
jgi:16S rRNA (guanine966-N2)-methyltransferase